MSDHVHPLRGTTIVLAVLAAVAGPVVLTPDKFVAYFVVGVFFGGVHSAMLWGATRHGDPVTPAVMSRIAGSAAAGAVVAVVGACLVPAIGVGGAVAVLATVVSAPYVLRRFSPKRSKQSRSATAATLDLLTPPLHVFSTAEISAAWSTSHEALRRSASPADRSAIAALRQAYLDELERRDAEGMQRWLDSGRALHSDPHDFLRSSGQGDPDPDPR